jgi:hypothetical protein
LCYGHILPPPTTANGAPFHGLARFSPHCHQPLPLTTLPKSANLGCPITALSCNKENQHKKTKILTGTSGLQTQLRRRKRVRVAPTGSCVVAPVVVAAHEPMHRRVRQNVTSQRRSRPSNSEPEPMSIEIPAEADPSNFRRGRERREEQAIKPAVSSLKYNFPRFLPRYPMSSIKAEALAAINKQPRDICRQFILDDILINLAPVCVSPRCSVRLTCNLNPLLQYPV